MIQWCMRRLTFRGIIVPESQCDGVTWVQIPILACHSLGCLGCQVLLHETIKIGNKASVSLRTVQKYGLFLCFTNYIE